MHISMTSFMQIQQRDQFCNISSLFLCFNVILDQKNMFLRCECIVIVQRRPLKPCQIVQLSSVSVPFAPILTRLLRCI